MSQDLTVATLPRFATYEKLAELGLYKSVHAARRGYRNGELPKPTQNGGTHLFDMEQVVARFRERAGALNPRWSKAKAAEKAQPVTIKRSAR